VSSVVNSASSHRRCRYTIVTTIFIAVVLFFRKVNSIPEFISLPKSFSANLRFVLVRV